MRNRLLFTLLSVAVVVPLLTGTLLSAATDQEGDKDSLTKYLSMFTEVLSLVRQAYVDEPDVGQLMNGALNGVTDALDPFSVYVPAGEIDAFLAAREVGEKRSGLLMLKERGFAYAVAVMPGSPAEQAGLKVGDLIAKIDGRSTRLIPVWNLYKLLGGKPGTRLELELIRQGEPSQATLELAAFPLPGVALEEVRGEALLAIGHFGSETAAAVRQALAGAKQNGRNRLLLDLRGVAGGDPEAAYAVAGLFSGGELGSLKNQAGTVRRFTGGEAADWQGKVLVLVNRSTLGPAEILATVLRQKLGAELVGERTFGYAGRQELIELATGGRLLLTDAFYTGPDGESLNESLDPDVAVDHRPLRFGEQETSPEDLILERALERLQADEETTASGRKAA